MSKIDEENSKMADAAVTKRVEVVPYDPSWTLRFEELQQVLLNILSGLEVRVEHVGSPSVPGLAAKPILDVDIVLQKPADFAEVKTLLERNGYHHAGDLGVSGREAFKYQDKPLFMRHHLYVQKADAAELQRHLALRDWLRSHPQDRDAYGQVKIAAAQEFPNDINAYIDAKSDIIFEIYTRCGLYQPQGMQELARSVIINRYGLRLEAINCKPLQPGVFVCPATTEEGAFCLLAWEKADSSIAEISRKLNAFEGKIALPLPSASGKQLCITPFGMFALFSSEEEALTFLSSDLLKNRDNL